MIKALLMMVLINQIYCKVPFVEESPQVTSLNELDTVMYRGKWYEVEKYFTTLDIRGKCNVPDVAFGPFGKLNSRIKHKTNSITVIRSTPEGGVHVEDLTDVSKINLPVPLDEPYWVLDTDYNSYSVMWSCNQYGLFTLRNSWILTRAKNPPVEVLEKAYTVMDRNGIERENFIRTFPIKCPHIVV